MYDITKISYIFFHISFRLLDIKMKIYI